MKLALSQEGESHAHFREEARGGSRRRRAGEDQAARVTVMRARAVRLVGASRPAHAGGYSATRRSAGQRIRVKPRADKSRTAALEDRHQPFQCI